MNAQHTRPVEADLTLDRLVRRAGATAKAKGFWDERPTFGDLIALVHTELSEALEAFRDTHDPARSWAGEGGKPEGAPSELADVVIRVADICARFGIDLAAEIDRKLAYNDRRPALHGGRGLRDAEARR